MFGGGYGRGWYYFACKKQALMLPVSLKYRGHYLLHFRICLYKFSHFSVRLTHSLHLSTRCTDLRKQSISRWFKACNTPVRVYDIIGGFHCLPARKVGGIGRA